MNDVEVCREAFERHYGRARDPARILWKRGGSAFAENIDAAEYVDRGVQRMWNDWQAAWAAAITASSVPTVSAKPPASNGPDEQNPKDAP